MYRTDDPVADFNAWDAEQAKRLGQLPVCADCENEIQDDHYYVFDGRYYCPECVEDSHRQEADDGWL